MGVGGPQPPPAGVPSLRDRRPSLGASELVASLVPPRRFADVRFETYLPDPAHPSQAAARREMERFADALGGPAAGEGGRRALRSLVRGRRAETVARWEGPAGRYLDGAYGVGKTHLLAALWHASPTEAAYLTFAELTSIIGFLGMDAAVDAFGHFGLLCLDEFELDDVANTLMAVTFLRRVIGPAGTKVVTTSNSLPDRLGEGRFHAADFRREIQAIAEHFDVVRVDGPDYRARTRTEADPWSAPDVDEAVAHLDASGRTHTTDALDDLMSHLRTVHPVQYHAVVQDLDVVVLRGLRPIANQGDALLFVRLVDELYDAEVPVIADGCAVGELFPDAYRHGGYRKKYGRCESRLGALLGEARDLVAF